MNRRLGGNPEPVWKFWRIEKSLVLARMQTLVHPPHSLVAVPTMLPHLVYIRLHDKGYMYWPE
jgi:hypothetical protein